MEIKKELVNLKDAPCMIVYEDNILKAGSTGTILFYHGFTASKELNQKEYKSLAKLGFLVVGVDSIGHGKRRYPDFETRFSSETILFEEGFINIIKESAKESPIIIDELHKKYKIDENRIGICGISMGGFIAYYAALIEERIKVVTPILGSPRWNVFVHESPYNFPEKFFPKAILSQNAQEDKNVSPQDAKEFHKALVPYYKLAPERQLYIEFPNVGHFMPAKEWKKLWDNVLKWFNRFLKAY